MTAISATGMPATVRDGSLSQEMTVVSPVTLRQDAVEQSVLRIEYVLPDDGNGDGRGQHRHEEDRAQQRAEPASCRLDHDREGQGDQQVERKHDEGEDQRHDNRGMEGLGQLRWVREVEELLEVLQTNEGVVTTKPADARALTPGAVVEERERKHPDQRKQREEGQVRA